MKVLKQKTDQAISLGIGRVWTDPWFAMLCAGGLGHQMHIQLLMHLSYWNMWLICFGLQALWPLNPTPTYQIEDEV